MRRHLLLSSATATQAAATPVTHAFCLPGHAQHTAAGNTQTRDDGHKEDRKKRQSWDVTVKFKRTVDIGPGGQKVFSLFSNQYSWTGLTCQCPPTSSLIQSHSYHSGQSGATGNNYERRDNLAHFDCTTGSAKSTATCRYKMPLCWGSQPTLDSLQISSILVCVCVYWGGGLIFTGQRQQD